MNVNNKCISGLFIWLVLLAPGICLAQQKATANQRPQFYFDKPIRLDSLTKYVHRHSTVRFTFNSAKVKGDKVINLKKGTYTIGLLLQEIRKNTSLYYTLFNGYVVFQDNPPKQKTSAAKVSPRKTNKPVVKPVPQTGSGDTTKIIAHKKTDTAIRVVAVNTPVHIDTVPIIYRPKDTTGANQLITTMDGNAHSKEYIDVVKNTSGQLQPGIPRDPVYKDSSIRPWIKDTMQAKTIGVRAATGKKDGRIVAQPSRKESDDKDDATFHTWYWQYGLHWKVAVPLYGFDYYLTGPDNRSQPYNPLIPGIWLSRRNEHHELLLLVKPAEWTVYGNKVIRTDSSNRKYGPDTIPVYVPIRKTTSFIKSGGMYAGLQYNFHLNERFIVGAGIGYQTQRQTLGLQQMKRIIDTGQFGNSFPDTLFSVKGDSLTNNYLNPSLILAKFEIAYKSGQVDMGAALVLPLTSPFTSKSRDQSRPLSVQLFVRWRLKREEHSD